MLPGLLFIDPVISNPYQNFVDNIYNPSWTFLVYSTAGWAIKDFFFLFSDPRISRTVLKTFSFSSIQISRKPPLYGP